jgi:inhibitor of KinA sporulation pathway (predicted exonuclease)
MIMKTVEEMLKELEVATQEMLFVPNDLLPESFHDNVRGGRTLARLNEMCEELSDTETEHQKTKAIKARNIEKLLKQVEEESDLQHSQRWNGFCRSGKRVRLQR